MAKLTAQAGVRYLLENSMAYIDGLVREFDRSPSMSAIEGVRISLIGIKAIIFSYV